MKHFFFSNASDAERNHALIESRDDHAFLRPGTSVGFQGSRTQKVTTPVDPEKQRQLPKYDFPEAKMYCAGGAHRIFTMKPYALDKKKN